MKIRTLVDHTLMKYIEDTDDIYNLPMDQLFDRMERVYCIEATCMSEICHLLTLGNMRDLSHILESIVKGYKYIYECLLASIIQQHENIAQMKNKKADVVYMYKEVAKRELNLPSVMYLDSFKQKEEIEKEIAKEKAINMFNFRAEEEVLKLIEERRKVVMKKVDFYTNEMEMGRKLHLKREEEPDVLLAFCKETFDSMSRESEKWKLQTRECITGTNMILEFGAEAPAKIERIVQHIFSNINKLNIDKLIITEKDFTKVDEERDMIEKAILSSVDVKQRHIAVRVLQIMANFLKPPSKTKDTMTPLTAKQLEGVKLNTSGSTDRTAVKLRLAQEECEDLKNNINGQKKKINAMESLVQDMMIEIKLKEDEVIRLMGKYERDKLTEIDMQSRRSEFTNYGDKLNQVMSQGNESTTRDTKHKEKMKMFIKGISQTLFSNIGPEFFSVLPSETFVKFKKQLASGLQMMMKEGYGSSAKINVDSIIEEQIKFYYPAGFNQTGNSSKRPSFLPDLINGSDVDDSYKSSPSPKKKRNITVFADGSSKIDLKDADSIQTIQQQQGTATIYELEAEINDTVGKLPNKKSNDIPHDNSIISKSQNQRVFKTGGAGRSSKTIVSSQLSINPKNKGESVFAKNSSTRSQAKLTLDEGNNSMLSSNDLGKGGYLIDHSTISDPFLKDLAIKLEAINSNSFNIDMMNLIDIVSRLGSMSMSRTIMIGNKRIRLTTAPTVSNESVLNQTLIQISPGQIINSTSTFKTPQQDDQIKETSPKSVKTCIKKIDKSCQTIPTSITNHSNQPKTSKSGNTSVSQNNTFLSDRRNPNSSNNQPKFLISAESQNIALNLEVDPEHKSKIQQTDPKTSKFMTNLRHHKIFDTLYSMTDGGRVLPVSTQGLKEPPHPARPHPQSTHPHTHNKSLDIRATTHRGMSGTHLDTTAMHDDTDVDAGRRQTAGNYFASTYRRPAGHSRSNTSMFNSTGYRLGGNAFRVQDQKMAFGGSSRQNSYEARIRQAGFRDQTGEYEENEEKQEVIRQTLKVKVEKMTTLKELMEAGVQDDKNCVPPEVNSLAYVKQTDHKKNEFVRDMYDILYPNQSKRERFEVKDQVIDPMLKVDGIHLSLKQTAFKQEIFSFADKHQVCGEQCPHLLRFYQRKGFFKSLNFYNNRRTLNMPKIQVDQDVRTTKEIKKLKKQEKIRQWTIQYRNMPTPVSTFQ